MGAASLKRKREVQSKGGHAEVRTSSPLRQPKMPRQLSPATQRIPIVLGEGPWYEEPALSGPYPASEESQMSLSTVQRLHKYGQTLWQLEVKSYETKKRTSANTGNGRFVETMMRSGTLSDKIGALTLAILESPLHNCRYLEILIGLASKRSRAQAVEGLGALRDIFCTASILPPSRKLRRFDSQPLLQCVGDKYEHWTEAQAMPKPITPFQLILWTFEDWLKEAYLKIVRLLESWSKDQIVFARNKAVDFIFALLDARPEQEEILLRLLINKLSDHERKVASKASFRILRLENNHPAMVATILDYMEVEIIFRPGQKLLAKYYAINTLSQTVLTSSNQMIIKRLLDIYFATFLHIDEMPQHVSKESRLPEAKAGQKTVNSKPKRKDCPNQNNELSPNTQALIEKIMSATLIGINRAMPFSKDQGNFLEKQIDSLFKITHSSNIGTAIQALALIQQIRQGLDKVDQRFHRCLYAALLDPRLFICSRHLQLLNLLFKALRSEVVKQRLEAYAKRSLQIAALHDPEFACGLLYLLSETVKKSVDVSRPEDHKRDNGFELSQLDQENFQGFTKTIPTYDGYKRDPVYSNALKVSRWESTILYHHFHPSVSLFSHAFEGLKERPPKPDLTSSTLIHFLSKFEHKKPKVSTSGRQPYRGDSIMQPAMSNHGSLLSNSTKVSRFGEPEEEFFQRYFAIMGMSKSTKQQSKRKESSPTFEDDDEDGVEDEAEDEVIRALTGDTADLDTDDDMTFDDYDDSGSISSQQATGFDNAEDSDAELSDSSANAHSSDGEQTADVHAKSKARQMDVNNSKRASHDSRRSTKDKSTLPVFAALEDYEDVIASDGADGDFGEK